MFVITAKEKIPLQIDITGTLHQVAKTDNNPHGLSISNLKQKITK